MSASRQHEDSQVLLLEMYGINLRTGFEARIAESGVKLEIKGFAKQL